MNIYMLSNYLKETYGRKIHKLLLSSGLSCPNRDGTCGNGGCIFCSEGGSGEFSESKHLSINKQIESAKSKLAAKGISENRYIAYFQSFSNTYASVGYLKKLYYPIVKRDDILILDIATRPDCIDDKTLDLLTELNKIKPVWIELGLQTSNENTANLINRGYPLSVYIDTAKKLRERDIKVITHLILGLPGENKDIMIKSAKLAGTVSDGIKFHTLFIQEGTKLQKMYENDEFSILSLEDYIDILCDCIRNIPINTVIHRLTGDPEKNTLVAPIWAKNKIKVLREINNAIYDKNVIQGEYL